MAQHDETTEENGSEQGLTKPTAEPSPFFVAMRLLPPDEQTFVRALLKGIEPHEAAASAFKAKGPKARSGYHDRDSAGFHLSKPAVLNAIKAGIPRCSDVRVAYQLLSYISLTQALNIIETGTNQEKITLIRDIWDRAGYVAVHKSESKRLDVKGILSDIQARRLKAVP